LLCVRDLFRDERLQDECPVANSAARCGSGGEMTKRYCLTLDLQDDPHLIAEYKQYHEKIWPEITKSIKDSGIENLEIYQLGTRLCMVMEVNEQFSFTAKAKADQENPKVQE